MGLGATAGAALGKGVGQRVPALVLAEGSLWIGLARGRVEVMKGSAYRAVQQSGLLTEEGW